MGEYDDALGRVIDEIVAPGAAEVDATGRFPAEAITALGEAGILGLTVATDAGGGGQGMRQGAEVVGRLAEVCGSTAMVVLMHYAATVVIEHHGPDDIREAIAAGRHLTHAGLLRGGVAQPLLGAAGHRRRPAGGVGPPRRPQELGHVGGEARQLRVVEPARWQPTGPMTLWLVPSDAAGLRGGRALRRPGPARQRLDAGGRRRSRRSAASRHARRRRRRPRRRPGRGAAVVPGPERRRSASA